MKWKVKNILFRQRNENEKSFAQFFGEEKKLKCDDWIY